LRFEIPISLVQNHRFSKNFLKFDIENQESIMESQTLNFLYATEMSAFGSPAHQLRRARMMQMLTAPVSQDGLGLNPAQVQDKTAAATLSVCKVLYNRSFEPNAVGHELFQLLVWKHIHLGTCESCARCSTWGESVSRLTHPSSPSQPPVPLRG
jgi:hypothetical protein